MAYLLWLAIYPICWSCLEKQQQVMLAKPIIQLLSKEHHIRQAHHRPNVVQVSGATGPPAFSKRSSSSSRTYACCTLEGLLFGCGTCPVACPAGHHRGKEGIC
jgi:hypothetical protein